MLLWITAISLIVAFSCERLTQPRLGGEAFTLQEVATLVTESYLRLHAGQVVPGSTLRVYRNGQMLWQKPYTEADSIVYDSTLAPAHTYTYRAELWSGSRQLARSNAVTVTTLDTTSHDFEWEIIEFPSPYGSGALYDVAIINENDIWAVGEIYSDSTQPWLPYNAVHWDGEKWELKRIKTNSCGGVDYPPIRTILSFTQNDILFGHIDASITHFDGINFINNCNFIQQINGSINKMWGTSSRDFYIVGNNGLVAHYDGSSWQRMESGTELGLTDIWGVSEKEIYAIGVNRGQYLGIVLLYDGNGWQKLIDGVTKTSGFEINKLFKTQLYGTTESVWVDEMGTVYTVGNLMYQYRLGKWDFVRSLPENYLGGNPGNYYRGYLYAVRGNRSNDMFIVGEGNTCIHFNGMTWRKLGPEYMPFTLNYWLDLAVTEKTAVVVGSSYHDGIRWARIMRLWR